MLSARSARAIADDPATVDRKYRATVDRKPLPFVVMALMAMVYLTRSAPIMSKAEPAWPAKAAQAADW